MMRREPHTLCVPAEQSANSPECGKQTGRDGFFARVHALVAGIPPGKVMTYGQIADFLQDGRSARYVGYAMRAAPTDKKLPCHRVVNKKGEMAPAAVFGGEDRQKRLLMEEGVAFRADGRIDFSLSLFEPE